MKSLLLFNLVGFDQNGDVCATKKFDENQSRSNYLYLISKYNQAFLKEQEEPVPAFFKDELGKVLCDVENGKDFESAKAQVLKNCLPEVQSLAKTESDRDLILSLADKLLVKDEKFASRFQKAVNNLELSYIITQIAGKVFDSIDTNLDNLGDKKSKSELFKSVIKYNSLVNTAGKIQENKIQACDLIA